MERNPEEMLEIDKKRHSFDGTLTSMKCGNINGEFDLMIPLLSEFLVTVPCLSKVVFS